MIGHSPRVALYLVVLGFSAAPARAQLLDQFLPGDVYGSGNEAGVTVTSRVRPDFEPLGLRAGSFIIRPQITESGGYESNVVGRSKAQGSAFVESSASVEAASDVSRATVRAGLRVDDTRYIDLPKQSYTNWQASLGGSYDVGRDTVTASYRHLNLNQTVRDLDVPQLNEAIPYRVDAGRLDYKIPFNRLFVQPAIDVANYDYSNGMVNGAVYDQTYRNRVVATPSVTVGYEFAPRRNALLVVRDSIASYSTRSGTLPRRDYNDGAVLAGLEYDLTGLIRFRVLGGYEVRTFSSSAYKTISAPIVEGTVAWTPTGLTTVTGTVARRILDSADESTVGFTETSLRLRVDHEYLRNVLLNAKGAVFLGEYGRGGGSQTLITAGAGADYLLNRNVRLSAGYDFASRSSGGSTSNLGSSGVINSTGNFSSAGSTGSFSSFGTGGQQFGSSYVDHRIMLRIRLQL